MKRSARLLALPAAISILFSAASVRAQGNVGSTAGSASDQGSKQDVGPCATDSAKFCAGMKPGDGKWGPCMKSHKDDLSDACKQKIGAAKEKIKGKMEEKAQEACGADTDKLCSGMKPGDGKWGGCMKEHKADLSPKCRMFMSRMGRLGRMAQRRGKGAGDKGSSGADQSSSGDEGGSDQ